MTHEDVSYLRRVNRKETVKQYKANSNTKKLP